MNSLRRGVDGEEALSTAFSKTFPFADELRCTIHSKRNVEGKLSEFALPSQTKNVIINDIYGLVEGTHHQEGLIHSDDSDTFLPLTESIKTKWDSLEKPHLPNNVKAPRFHTWFVANVSLYMRKCMISDIRLRNNIDSNFTTNQSESLNSMLGKHVNFKAHRLDEFLNMMKVFYDDQEEEVRSAFIGEGDFLLSDRFEQFRCGEDYYTMDQNARNTWEKAFYRSTVSDNQNNQRKVKPAELGTAIPGLDEKHSFNIVRKANGLIASNGVVPFTETSFHVKNSDGNRPHYVMLKGDLFMCDNNDKRFGCISYAGNHVCSHTYAAALYTNKVKSFMDALEKKSGTSSSPNLTNIANFGLKEGAGKKSGTKRTRKSRKADTETVTSVTDQHKSPIRLKIKRTSSDTHTVVTPSTKEFHLSLLADHPRVTSCGGCPYRFPCTSDKMPFPPPDDLIIYHIEQATWRDKTSGVLRVSNRPQNRYYHPNMQCVRKGNNGSNISFSFQNLEYSDIKNWLTNEHLNLLHKNFGEHIDV